MDFIDFHQIEVRENEPLSKHSSFRIGGPAKYAVFPKNTDELVFATDVCKNKGLKYKIVGNASNILFDDKGFDGAIIFTSHLCDTEYIHKNGYCLVKAECGKSLTELASETGKKHSLSGLEFAYGIPGTVGGAIFMNAGAYGGQMSDVVTEIEYLDLSSGGVLTLTAANCNFSYRHSVFAEHPEYVVLSATIRLNEGDTETIFSKMSQHMTSRREKQPLEYPNAGSTFKRPSDDIFVGKLVEDAGLKGFSIGGAQVSRKHAGFTVNCGGATSKDVLALIDHVKKVISDQFGVELECEIIYVPYN